MEALWGMERFDDGQRELLERAREMVKNEKDPRWKEGEEKEREDG